VTSERIRRVRKKVK